MTTKAKIAVTLSPERVEAAKLAVAEGRAESVSAYVERALLQFEGADPLLIDIEETLMKTGGPITDEERAQIRREFGL